MQSGLNRPRDPFPDPRILSKRARLPEPIRALPKPKRARLLCTMQRMLSSLSVGAHSTRSGMRVFRGCARFSSSSRRKKNLADLDESQLRGKVGRWARGRAGQGPGREKKKGGDVSATHATTPTESLHEGGLQRAGEQGDGSLASPRPPRRLSPFAHPRPRNASEIHRKKQGLLQTAPLRTSRPARSHRRNYRRHAHQGTAFVH